MNRSILFVGLFTIFMGSNLSFPSENYIALSGKLFSTVNQFNCEYGFKGTDIDYSASKLKIIPQDDPEFGLCTEISGYHAFFFIRKSGEPCIFLNSKVENTESLQKPEKANWESSKVEKLVLDFIGRISPEVPKQLLLESIQFRESKEISGISEWRVFFNRKSLDGILYENDRFGIGVSETKGVSAYRLRFFSPAKSFGPPKISKENALKLAGEERKRMLEWPSAAEHFSSQNLAVEPFEVVLRIVNANYLRTQHNLMEAMLKVFEGDAKLAWVVRYRGTEKNPPPDTFMAPTQLDIWVHALTGEIIGGRY